MNEGDRIIMFVDHLLNKFWIRIAKMTLIYECSKNGRKRFLMDEEYNMQREILIGTLLAKCKSQKNSESISAMVQ